MENLKFFSGETEAEIWQQIKADLATQNELFEYAASIKHQGRTIFFGIETDPGGGFEGGYQVTNFSAPLVNNIAFRFRLYHQDWVNEIGKALGMQDVKVGYPELDDAFIVKTNQPEMVKALFSNERLGRILLKHQNAQLKLDADYASDSPISLLFTSDVAYTNPADLQDIYRLMYGILERIDPVS